MSLAVRWVRLWLKQKFGEQRWRSAWASLVRILLSSLKPLPRGLVRHRLRVPWQVVAMSVIQQNAPVWFLTPRSLIFVP